MEKKRFNINKKDVSEKKFLQRLKNRNIEKFKNKKY